MPQQDHSLPFIVPLPKLATPRTITSTKQTQILPSCEDDTVIVERNKLSGHSDDEYDILEYDHELLTVTALLPERLVDTIVDSPGPINITTSEPTATTTQTVSSPFVDMLLQDAAEQEGVACLPMTVTENGAPTFASSGDPRLDFFFEVLHGIQSETILKLARESWPSNPLDTLRLIFQLRSIVHGKGDRRGFYVCMQFLRDEHPKTMLYNLKFIPDHGYWKDMLNWLVFEVRQNRINYHLSTRERIPKKGHGRNATKMESRSHQKLVKTRLEADLPDSDRFATDKGARAANQEERQRTFSDQARKARLARDQDRLERARSKFMDDTAYRALHLGIAQLFANALVRDKSRTIAQIISPDKRPQEDHIAYVNRVRELLRQQFYVPLRKVTPVLETLMSSQRWDTIAYNRVPAIAMKNNKHLFEVHDKERFEIYLESLAKGETTIAAQALLPHQLVREAFSFCGNPDEDLGMKTLEAQWRSYVDRLAKTGSMESTMAICDVSGSMSGEPIEVAIALSLLLTELTRPPFNQLVLTFSEAPQVHRVKEGSLKSKVNDLRRMQWGCTTDLAKAFDHILQIAVQNKVDQQDMVKTLFIFSDMEFDTAVQGAGTSGEMFTNYKVVKRQFKKAGYMLPQIVFWDLRGSNKGNKPVASSQSGVAMVSGFNGALMKLFLNGVDLAQELSPVKLMEKAIQSKEFSRLKVLD